MTVENTSNINHIVCYRSTHIFEGQTDLLDLQLPVGSILYNPFLKHSTGHRFCLPHLTASLTATSVSKNCENGFNPEGKNRSSQ